jgi:hypothetical protein
MCAAAGHSSVSTHHACQGPPVPLTNLSAPPAILVTTSVRAVEHPGFRLENLSADAPGLAKLQCALKGGRPLACKELRASNRELRTHALVMYNLLPLMTVRIA